MPRFRPVELALILLLISGSVSAAKIYVPKGSGNHPAVIVLHSKAGLTSHEKKFAYHLYRAGYAAVAVNFHARGGTDNISSAYDKLAQNPRVKSESIGIVGFSKGAFQAMQFAYISPKFSNRRIKAIVSFYIGPMAHYSSENFPSILFLHGDRDQETPADGIERYCQKQRAKGLVCESKIYSGVRHAFDRRSIEYEGYNINAKTDSYKRAFDFLSRELN